jgi:riboflavin kinase / FMN adenylyltransferase
VEVVPGVERLTSRLGPMFVVVGVFDGLHLGHAYLLRHLVAEATLRDAAPTVITFDHHPDEILVGNAPPLLLDPTERLERLAASGVAVTVVQHFDDALRRTTYDAFVERIRSRVELRGFLMTPDAAFGFERRGTPEALTSMGERDGFEVVVVPPFDLHGRHVRSSEIRDLIRAGDLTGAAELLGRPVTLTGTLLDGRLTFDLPMAVPPDGSYEALVRGRATTVELRDGGMHLAGSPDDGRVSVEFV